MTDKEQRKNERNARATGCLVGLAVGDALGAALEFLPREEVRRRHPEGLREMVASTIWGAGEYTDDTQMALLIADSLVEHGRIEAKDLARRFYEWKKTAKDVGIMTRAVLGMPGYLGAPEECASRHHKNCPDESAGNGAVMRCAPVAIAFADAREKLVEESMASARVTHADPKAQESCAILNLWIAEILSTGQKDGIGAALEFAAKKEPNVWRRLGRIRDFGESEVLSSGYTVHTLEAAAWSFLTTESFEEAVVRAANLGDDADTVGAVCGAVAGAYYGYQGIPERWIAKLKDERKIRRSAEALVALARII